MSDDILKRIDSVVKASDEISDELIEERARANGLARVPRNVTEVVDVLFGHINPQRGKPYLADEEGIWNDRVTLDVDRQRTYDRLSAHMDEITRLQAVHRIERTLAIDSSTYTARMAPNPDIRRQFAEGWREQAHRIVERAFSRGELNAASQRALYHRIEGAYTLMIQVRPGEEIPTTPDEEVIETGGGRWRLRRRQPAVERSGEPRQPWYHRIF